MSSIPLRLVRIKKQLQEIDKDPIPNSIIKQNTDFQIHFCVYGLQEPYQDGYYHGVIKLHEKYPFEPPKLYMLTPSGRFVPDKQICTSFSNFHKESWSILWGIRTIVLGFISFMMDNSKGIGSLNAPKQHKLKLAQQSLSFNLKNPTFVSLFKQSLQKNGVNLIQSEEANDQTDNQEQVQEDDKIEQEDKPQQLIKLKKTIRKAHRTRKNKKKANLSHKNRNS